MQLDDYKQYFTICNIPIPEHFQEYPEHFGKLARSAIEMLYSEYHGYDYDYDEITERVNRHPHLKKLSQDGYDIEDELVFIIEDHEPLYNTLRNIERINDVSPPVIGDKQIAFIIRYNDLN